MIILLLLIKNIILIGFKMQKNLLEKQEGDNHSILIFQACCLLELAQCSSVLDKPAAEGS